MKKTILYFLLIAPAMAGAQNILTQNTDWSTNKTFEISTGKMLLEPNKVVTYKSEKIEWLDARGTLKLSFPIKSTTGSWADIKSAGEMCTRCKWAAGQKQKWAPLPFAKAEQGLPSDWCCRANKDLPFSGS